MKKLNIIKEKRDFDEIFRNHDQYDSKFSYIYIKDNNLLKYRFGICVSKKVGNAVIRNRLKRRIKDIIDKSKLQFGFKDYIIVVRKGASDVQYEDLKNDILGTLNKIIDRR